MEMFNANLNVESRFYALSICKKLLAETREFILYVVVST